MLVGGYRAVGHTSQCCSAIHAKNCFQIVSVSNLLHFPIFKYSNDNSLSEQPNDALSLIVPIHRGILKTSAVTTGRFIESPVPHIPQCHLAISGRSLLELRTMGPNISVLQGMSVLRPIYHPVITHSSMLSSTPTSMGLCGQENHAIDSFFLGCHETPKETPRESFFIHD